MNKFKTFFSNIFKYQTIEEHEFILPEKKDEANYSNTDKQDDISTTNVEIFSKLSDNMNFVKEKYSKEINSDVEIREFSITVKNKLYNAFLLFIDGMVDSDIINNYILKPLMLRNSANTYEDTPNQAESKNITIKKDFNLDEYISNCLLPQNSIKKSTNFKDLFSDVNSGNCALFIDTLNTAFDIDVKGFKQRSVESPKNEIVIRGSQEAFTEVIRTNTSLIRRLIHNENLIIEDISIGSVSDTACAVCYLKNIANDDLVNEVKYRLNNLNIDYLISSGQLEQLIEDDGNFSLPQTISTERPDKVSNYLLEGRVAILVNGSPYSLVVPGTFLDFIASPEDRNLKYQYANLLKLLRIVGIFITLLLPGLYIAISTFHQELIPTELLFAIAASRVSVPFPIIFEIFVMEFSFELIREAGVRVPSPVGPTIGIVGALILGQAAVNANIISPILIIIVALTGICSFTIPDFSLSFHFRIARFIYILLGYFAGFFGIAIGLFIHCLILSAIHSFGAPYLQPYSPVTNISRSATYFLKPAWKREYRADFLNTKKPRKQKHISMKWKY